MSEDVKRCIGLQGAFKYALCVNVFIMTLSLVYVFDLPDFRQFSLGQYDIRSGLRYFQDAKVYDNEVNVAGVEFPASYDSEHVGAESSVSRKNQVSEAAEEEHNMELVDNEDPVSNMDSDASKDPVKSKDTDNEQHKHIDLEGGDNAIRNDANIHDRERTVMKPISGNKGREPDQTALEDNNSSSGPSEEHIADWQTVRENVLYVYTAHLDARDGNGLVKVIGGMHVDHLQDNVTCQLWYGGSQKHVAMATIEHIEHLGFIFPGVLLKCLFPIGPWEFPDDASIILRIDSTFQSGRMKVEQGFKKPENRKFTVCLWAPLITIDSRWIVEWLETNILLGADFFHFYIISVSADVASVMEYYEKCGVLNVRPWHRPKPTGDGLLVHINFQVAMIADCQQRSINKTLYIVGSDQDEIIVPRGDMTTWKEMIHNSGCPSRSAFGVRSVLFIANQDSNQDPLCEGLRDPCCCGVVCNASSFATNQRPYLRTMCITEKKKGILHYPARSKFIASPVECETFAVHRPGRCTHGLCVVNVTTGAIHHYRNNMIRGLPDPDESLHDNYMHVFWNKLSRKVQQTWRNVKLAR